MDPVWRPEGANPGRVPGVFDVSVFPLPSEDAGRTGLNGFFAFCSAHGGLVQPSVYASWRRVSFFPG